MGITALRHNLLLIPALFIIVLDLIQNPQGGEHHAEQLCLSHVIADLTHNPEGQCATRPVIPRGSGNPQGQWATMPSIVILDLIQNLGGDTRWSVIPRGSGNP